MGPKKKKPGQACAESPSTSATTTPKLKSKDGSENTVCKMCSGSMENDAAVIACDCCYHKFHITCCKIPEPIFNIFGNNNLKSFGFLWKCSLCKTNITKSSEEIIEEVNGLKLCINSMMKKLDNVIHEVESQKTNIDEKITKYTETVSKDIKENSNKIKSYSETVSKNIEENSERLQGNLNNLKSNMEAKNEEEEEKKEKIAKEDNIVLYNVPESEKSNAKDAFVDDIAKLHSILDNHIQLKKEDIKAIYRMGQKNSKITRPIVMKMVNKNKRNEVLRLRGLEYKENTNDNEEGNEEEGNEEGNEDEEKDEEEKSIKIFTSPHRTKAEQEIHRKLVIELKERRSKGEQNIQIKNGKIIQYQPFRGDAQQCWAD